jgi:hypothetical protein
VAEEGHAFVLRSPGFDKLTDAGAVRQHAVELVEVLNGLAKITVGDFDAVSVGAVTGDDGSGTHSIFVVDEIKPRGRARGEVIDAATGQPVARGQASDLLQQCVISLREPNVGHALRVFAGPTSAENLWKVYEIIRDDVGDKRQLENMRLATPDEIERFRGVHYPSALGERARHAVEPSRPAPGNPMSLEEAQRFIARLLANWLSLK